MNIKKEQREIDLMTYWRIIVKRKWVIVSFTGALIFFTGVFSFLAAPKYKSTVTLHIEEGSSRILSIEDTFGYQSPVVRDLRFYNTQLKLIKSKSLAERVARKMNLLSHPEFGAGKRSKKSFSKSAVDFVTLKWLFSRKKSGSGRLRTSSPINPYSEIARVLQNGIDVKPIRETKLVEVSFTSNSSVLSADIVNTLSEEFINFSIEKRYETTQQASDFLSEQIANLRDELAVKERELQRYSQEKGLDFLNERESTAVTKLSDLNEAYTQAQIDRINAQVKFQELKDVDVDSLPQFITDPVIQRLKTDYTAIKNEYEEKSKKFKPSYPEMIQLKARLDSMTDELNKAVDAAESEYNSALKRERSLKSLLDEQKRNVVTMNSNAILYNSINIEVENKRKLLNSLVEKQNQTLVSAKLGGLRASNISIIDKAEVPRKAVSPKKLYNLTIALLIGLFGGVGLCFLLDYMDNTIKGPEDVERLTGLSSLGMIPYLDPEGMSKKKKSGYYSGYRHPYGGEEDAENKDALPEIKEIELANYRYPKLSISEDYRTIRSSILLSYAENPPKTIVFSSALPQEGKSSTVANMAVSFSQLGERVLVIDADLRKPRLHMIFDAKNDKGLSAYLTGKIYLKDAFKKTSIQNIWLLSSGMIPPNPVELLNSKKMKDMMEEIKKGFDVILIDTPPVLAVVDAAEVSALADSTVIVVKAAKTTNRAFCTAVEKLRQARAKIMGVLYNEMKVKSGDYYYMDYYRSYGSYETDTDSK